MPIRVLFVCMGNICRSPLAEGILRHLVEKRGLEDRFRIDSAGTGAWHVGEPPDRRSYLVAAAHGIDLDGQRARMVRDRDYQDFDHLFALDQDNFDDLWAKAPPEARGRIHLLREHDPEGVGDVPDPYEGGTEGFERVFAMIHRSCWQLLFELLEEGRAGTADPPDGEELPGGP